MNDPVLWFALKNISGLGNHTYKRLLEAFGSPEAIFSASPEQLTKIEGVSAKMANHIVRRIIPDSAARNIERCRKANIDIIPLTDPDYPRLLREIPDPPPYLYCRGTIDAEAACISIVGSRTPTRYGLSLAKQLSSDLADRGLIIVSGLARGIDTAAHEGALAAGGQTYAVLGNGLAHIYPPENSGLARDVRAAGALLSEFPVAATPEPYHFPLRNRVISGISVGTIVVEAARKSGSLITARLAAEQGREVLAVPGSTRSGKSTGTHGLLKQGAQLVENAGDVLEAVAHMLPSSSEASIPSASASASAPSRAKPEEELDKAEKQVLELLEPYPVHIDDIARKAGMDPGKTAGILLNLELKGLVEQEPGKRFLVSGT